ncbi:hypothetical protein [Sulfurospirillum sp. 1612]|uniref:hypothetical protein n=1 Tax=Sulfurospirillum sp. 1612 TaxID=3094835 RepID=UPI002F93BF3F
MKSVKRVEGKVIDQAKGFGILLLILFFIGAIMRMFIIIYSFHKSYFAELNLNQAIFYRKSYVLNMLVDWF